MDSGDKSSFKKQNKIAKKKQNGHYAQKNGVNAFSSISVLNITQNYETNRTY